MSRMTRKNLSHVKQIFQEKTGLRLIPEKPVPPIRKMVLLAAAVICCFGLLAFTYPLFSPLDGDELTLSAVYQGDGIVQICVENHSDKDLEFQPRTRLFSWIPEEEVAPMGGPVLFDNTVFQAHSHGVMTVDLSGAYEIKALEMEGRNPRSYYLLLTNQDFLFGHEWKCSIAFTAENRQQEEKHLSAGAEELREMEDALRFYFADSYQDQVLAWNQVNFEYLQKVEEMIRRRDAAVIAPVSPQIMVTGPSVMLDPQPVIKTEDVMADHTWVTADAYHRLVGASVSEKALAVTVNIPLKEYPDAVSQIPILFTFVYETDSVSPENETFVYGRFLSFRQMEMYQVYRDEHYTIFDVTDFFYQDLDAYLDFLQKTREDLNIDAEIRQEIHALYQTCRKDLGSLIGYSQ